MLTGLERFKERLTPKVSTFESTQNSNYLTEKSSWEDGADHRLMDLDFAQELS